MILLQLPYPTKPLWPNSRDHWAKKNAQTKLHRKWAWAGTKEVLPYGFKHDGSRIAIRLTVSGKATGSLPDKDNCIAACKAYFDGIADALGVNDNLFDPQPVAFSGRQSNFLFEVLV